MTSIKEVLYPFKRAADRFDASNPIDDMELATGITVGDLRRARAALAQLESADARETIARIIDPEAMVKSKPIHGYYPSISIKNRIDDALAKADAILATGLVPDEAAIRADEREKVARWHDAEADRLMNLLHCGDDVLTIGKIKRLADIHRDSAAAIRAGRAEG